MELISNAVQLWDMLAVAAWQIIFGARTTGAPTSCCARQLKIDLSIMWNDLQGTIWNRISQQTNGILEPFFKFFKTTSLDNKLTSTIMQVDAKTNASGVAPQSGSKNVRSRARCIIKTYLMSVRSSIALLQSTHEEKFVPQLTSSVVDADGIIHW